MATAPSASRVRQLWQRVVESARWTRPTSTEIGIVAKSGLAAGLAWWVAGLVTGAPDPVLAPLTAIVVVQVSVRSSVRAAIQRSIAVVLGVLLALAIGDALDWNALTVAALVAASLAVAELLLRLPPAAARQVPISGLVVLTAAAGPESSAWRRALDTVIGAAVGIIVSLVLPASRLVDARQTLERLGASLGDVLEMMGSGLQQPWSTDQSAEWRRTARAARERSVGQAIEAVGNSRESAQWNVRDRRHVDVLGRYEEIMPRLERTAIGVSVISRGLDDHVHLLAGAAHPSMPAMGELLVALAGAVRAAVENVLGEADDDSVARSLAEVRARRTACLRGAFRRARLALDQAEPGEKLVEGEWLGYAALLVQVDRIVGDLGAPQPV